MIVLLAVLAVTMYAPVSHGKFALGHSLLPLFLFFHSFLIFFAENTLQESLQKL